MKSSELIRRLQEEDPTGETEVCVGNLDIHFCSVEPSFWDGYLQVLSRDESKSPYYNLTGGKYVSKGNKIVLHLMSISDVLREDPDRAVVDYSEVSPSWAERMKEHDDKVRQSSRETEKRCDMDIFFRWVKKQAEALHPSSNNDDEVRELRDVADSFYEEHLSPNDPLKKLPPKKDDQGCEWWPSVVDRRESHWDDTVEVVFDGFWSVKLK